MPGITGSLGKIHVAEDGSLRINPRIHEGVDPSEIGRDVEEAKKKSLIPLEKRITTLAQQKGALADLQNKVNTLKKDLKGLAQDRTTLLQESLFDQVVAEGIDLSTGTEPTTLGYALTGRVIPQTLRIDSVSQVAQQDVVSGNMPLLLRDFGLGSAFVTTTDQVLGLGGIFSMGFEGNSSPLTLDLDPSWSLQTLVNQINADSRFQASAVLEEGSQTNYHLLIQASSPWAGQVLTFDATAVTGLGQAILPSARLQSVQVDPTTILRPGVLATGISALDTLPAGAYTAGYNATTNQWTLSNGARQWSTPLSQSGAQAVHVNGVTFLLTHDFDAHVDVPPFPLQITSRGVNQLKNGQNSAAGWEGTLVLGTTEGPATTIPIQRDWSLEKIVNTINYSIETTGVFARILENQFEFVSQEVAKALSIDLSGLRGYTTGTIVGVSYQDPASRIDTLSTKYTVQGVQHTIPSTKTTLIPGLLVDFHTPFDTTKSVVLSVDAEVSQIARSITSVIDSVNDFLETCIKWQTDPATLGHLADEDKEGYGLLRNSSTLRGIRTSMLGDLGSAIEESGLSTLSQIGISFHTQEGKFVIDNKKLVDAIANAPQDIKTLFAFTHDLSDNRFALTRGPLQQKKASFELDVSRDANGILSASFSQEGETYTAEIKIMGDLVFFEAPQGSPLEGVSLSRSLTTLAFNATSTVSCTTSKGIASLLSETLHKSAHPVTGTIQAELGRLEQEENSKKSQMERLEESAKKAGAHIAERLRKVYQALIKLEEMQRHVREMTESINGKD